MRSLLILTLATLVAACANGRPSATVNPVVVLDDGTEETLNAVCDGLRDPIDALVDVVIDEGTDAVVLATENVTVKYDEGCP